MIEFVCMKRKNTFLHVLILLVLNVILIVFDYYVANDFVEMLFSEWYYCVLFFFINALIINPIISYIFDYYLLSNFI